MKEKLEETIADYHDRREDIGGYGDVIIDLEKQLPTTCPTCGKKL